MLANMAMWSSLFGGNRERIRVTAIVGIVMMILGPLAAGLIQMAISRSREYAADAGGASLCGDPHVGSPAHCAASKNANMRAFPQTQNSIPRRLTSLLLIHYTPEIS